MSEITSEEDDHSEEKSRMILVEVVWDYFDFIVRKGVSEGASVSLGQNKKHFSMGQSGVRYL